MNIKEMQKEVENIKERNKRVEADKAWETSFIRRILIAVFTYILIVVFFYFAGLPNPWVNSIVPALAFVLSTLSLSGFKSLWMKRYRQ